MSRVIDAVLRLRDEFTKPLEKSINLMTAADKAGAKTRKSIEKFGNGIASVGSTLTKTVTAPLAGMAAVSYKSFESVDKQLSLVQATMGEAKWATADLSKELGDAMTKSIFSMDEGAAALVNYARQGFDAAEAASMLTPALNVAAGTSTDLAGVTSGLGNTLKAFGADASDAAHYADMLVQAQAQANTTASDLFQAMSVAGPIAKTVGWDFEDIATLVGAFGDMSIDASEGANALKTGLARLSGGNKTANDAMEALGISLYDNEGHMKSMVDVIDTLQGSFEGMTEQEQMYYASKLFGQNQMSKWLALINGPAADALGDMRDNITNASGNAQEAADALMTPLEKLSSTFDVFKYSVGETLADAIVPFIEKATELVDKFRQMSPEQKQQVVRWAAMAAAAGPLIFGFGKMITLGAKLLGVFSKVRGVFQGVQQAGGALKFVLGALSSPIGLVVAACAAIVGIVAIVITHLDMFKEAAGNVAAVVAPHIENLQEKFSGLQETAGPVIEFISDLLANVLVGAFEGAAEGIGTVIDGLAMVIQGITDVIQGVVDFVVAIANGDWAAAWDALGGIVQGVFDAIGGAIQSVVGLVQGLVGTIGGAAEKAKAFFGSFGKGGATAAVGHNAAGDPHWRGGWTTVNEKGGEIMNLPDGTQIIPHEASRNTPVSDSFAMARFLNEAIGSINRSKAAGGSPVSVSVTGNSFVVREEADIDKIGEAIARKVAMAKRNRGELTYSGNMA